MIKNNKGFSVIESLIVMVLICSVAAVAFYVRQSNNRKINEQPTEQQAQNTTNTFDCGGVFSVKYSNPLEATMTTSDPPQCLISNLKVEAMPAVGPLLPEQLGLFFNIDKTTLVKAEDYLKAYIEKSKETYSFDLKGQETLTLNSGKTAILSKLYGEHPVRNEFYFFIYLEDGSAITTSFQSDTKNKDLALSVLKSIE